jgi:hypothetical protein
MSCGLVQYIPCKHLNKVHPKEYQHSIERLKLPLRPFWIAVETHGTYSFVAEPNLVASVVAPTIAGFGRRTRMYEDEYAEGEEIDLMTELLLGAFEEWTTEAGSLSIVSFKDSYLSHC